MTSPFSAANPTYASIDLSRICLETDGRDVVDNQQQVQVGELQGRTIKKVLVGTAIAGSALFVFLFIMGNLVNSESTKLTGAGFGVIGFISLLSRLHCMGDYDDADMPID